MESFEDVLRGADLIAKFLFGQKSDRRIVYAMHERGQIPVFRVGGMICARKSVLTAHIEAQERASIERAGGPLRSHLKRPAESAPAGAMEGTPRLRCKRGRPANTAPGALEAV